MTVRVRIAAGAGYEALVAAVAAADPDWRQVLDRGEAAHRAHRAAGLTAGVTRFGRFGWINLAGLLAGSGGVGDLPRLSALVEALPPEELHVLLVGGRRAQLLALVDQTTLRSAVAGDAGAARLLRRAVGSEGSVLQISPWLLRAGSTEVKQACLELLGSLPTALAPAPVEPLRGRLREVGPQALLSEVAPGVLYGEGTLDEVVLVPCHGASPIIVVVDEVDRTVILHPPAEQDGSLDPDARLRRLGRAVGDPTRIRLLQELTAGPRTLAELCDALASPRTTLLHHLALLRAAGLVTITVPAGEANSYTVRPEGFDELARAARGFLLR